MRKFLIAAYLIMSYIYSPIAFISSAFFDFTPKQSLLYILIAYLPYGLMTTIWKQYNKRHPEKPLIETRFEQFLQQHHFAVYSFLFVFVLLVRMIVKFKF